MTFRLISTLQDNIFILNNSNEKFTNIIIWGIQNQSGTQLRNCGFMWEPGAFAAMLLPVIYFSILKDRFTITHKTLVFIIALLSTLSTTGYIGLTIIALWFFLNIKNIYAKLIFSPIVTIIAIYLFINLDFLGSKIQNHYSEIDNVVDNAYSNYGYFASLGRFGSAKMDLYDLMKNPIFGIGGTEEEMTSLQGKFINRTNGLTNYLLKFGILGFILFVYFMLKSGASLKKLVYHKHSYFFLLLILILSFSNGILFSPLFLSFQMLFLFYTSSYQISNIN